VTVVSVIETAQVMPSPLDVDMFREAMSLLAAPLTSVTTSDTAGRRWGFTASSVSSASLNPPAGARQLVEQLQLPASSHRGMRISDQRARGATPRGHPYVRQSRHRSVRRYDFGTWTGSQLPFLLDASAVFHCTITDWIPVGDHQLVIGELTGLRTGDSKKPLLWHRQEFCTTDVNGFR
jgi:flavin reductase ActVB